MGDQSPMLPALVGPTAKEQAQDLELSVSADNILQTLPPELTQFCMSRLVTEQKIDQPILPGARERTALGVTFLKLISPNVRNKMFRGKPLHDGTVLGKTPFYEPGKQHVAGFPFLPLFAWVEMSYGRWNQAEETVDTYCFSRDGVSPAKLNSWGALKCSECAHHPTNRPKYDDETDEGKQQRCKRVYHLMGVGGDWKDFYVLTIKGKSILNLYYKTIVPHIQNMREENRPWFDTTFMLGTVQAGNYYEYEVRNVLPTFPVPGSGEQSLFSFEGDSAPGIELSRQLLDKLQTICGSYVKERQETARRTVQGFLTSNISVADSSEDEELGDIEDDASSLD